jgi:hypothetical protein
MAHTESAAFFSSGERKFASRRLAYKKGKLCLLPARVASFNGDGVQLIGGGCGGVVWN